MRIKAEKYTTTIRGNVQIVVQPHHVVLQAVEELESGNLSIDEVMAKYEVKRATVKTWLKKYSELYRQRVIRRRVSKEEKQKAIRQVESGLLTRQEVANHYNVDVSTVSHWKKQYSCGMQSKSNKSEALQPADSKENNGKELQNQLEELHLKVYALETMIDLAEKEFKIDIRKKYGTKQ